MRLLLLTLLLHTTFAKRGREFWVKTDNTNECEKPDNFKLQITPALEDPTEACKKEGKICFCVSRDRTTWISACGQCVANFNLKMSKEGILQNLDREVEKKRLEKLKPGKTALNKLGKPEIGLDKRIKHLAKDDQTKLTKSRGYYGRGYAYRGYPVSSKSQSFPKYDAKDLLKFKEIKSNRIERNGAKTSRSHMRKHGFGRNFAKKFDRTKTDFKNLSKRLQRVKENVSKALVKDKSVRTAKKTVAKKPAPKKTSKKTAHKKLVKPAANPRLIKNKLAKHLKKAADIKNKKKEAKNKTKPQAKEKFFHGRPTLNQIKSRGRRPADKPVVNPVKQNAEAKPKKPEAKPKKPETKPKKPEPKAKKPEPKAKKPETKAKKPETKPKSDEKPVIDKVKKPEQTKPKPLRRNDLDDLAESMIKPKRVKQNAEIKQKPSVHKVKPGVIHNEVEQIKNKVEAARKKLKNIAKDFKTKKVDPKILKKNIVQIEKMQKEVDATLKRDKKLLDNFEKKSKP